MKGEKEKESKRERERERVSKRRGVLVRERRGRREEMGGFK